MWTVGVQQNLKEAVAIVMSPKRKDDWEGYAS